MKNFEKLFIISINFIPTKKSIRCKITLIAAKYINKIIKKNNNNYFYKSNRKKSFEFLD